METETPTKATTEIEPTFAFEINKYAGKDFLNRNITAIVSSKEPERSLLQVLRFVAEPPDHAKWKLTNSPGTVDVDFLVKVVSLIPEKFKAAVKKHQYEIDHAEEIAQARRVKENEEKKKKLQEHMTLGLAQLTTKLGTTNYRLKLGENEYRLKLGENERINVWDAEGKHGVDVKWNQWDEKWEIYHSSLGSYGRHGRSGSKKSKNILSLAEHIKNVIAYNQRADESAKKANTYNEKLLAAMTALGYVAHPRSSYDATPDGWMKAGATEKDPCFAKHQVKLDETGNVVVTSTSLTYNKPTELAPAAQ